MATTWVREDTEFRSDGTTCRAWLYRPETAARFPVVVMGHGLGATRAMGLAPYAERFAAAGLAALVVDYRHFGASDGEPRQLLSVRRQRADLRAAVDHARSLPGADPARTALWGTSFGGGHAIALGPSIPGLAAVVAQCPFTDGPSSVLALGPRDVLRVTLRAVPDEVAGLLRRPPVTVPTVAPGGGAALMTAPDAWPGYTALVDGETPPLDVAARIGTRIGLYRPGRALRRATVPTLVQVCEKDTVAPARATLRHARRATPAVDVRTYPYGHFEIYRDAPFEHSVTDQLTFLRRHLERS